MENSWLILYKTTNLFEANAILGNLESHNIPATILNKRDSSYNAFGDIEIHVPFAFEAQANEVLKNNNTPQ